jgi:hypothetical protein
MLLQNGDNSRGGFEIRDTTNVEMVDVNMHTYCLVWGLPCYGDFKFTRVRCSPLLQRISPDMPLLKLSKCIDSLTT